VTKQTYMNIVHSAAQRMDEEEALIKQLQEDYGLSAREVQFLTELCSDLSYKEIAVKLKLSTRTIEGYRNVLCEKVNVRTRVGLALFAVTHGLYVPPQAPPLRTL
jgi:DNA-binding NarL/FixJ family response regulator